MDISTSNAVTNSGTASLPTASKNAGKSGTADPTLNKDGKTAVASPSTIVNLQSSGKPTDADNSGTATATATGKDGAPSPVKAFTYGVLNLPNPETQPPPAPTPDDSYFTAGRWAAAAITVGTLISLVV